MKNHHFITKHNDRLAIVDSTIIVVPNQNNNVFRGKINSNGKITMPRFSAIGLAYLERAFYEFINQ